MCFAGQLAEAKFLGKHPRYGMGGDNEAAVDLAEKVCTSPETTEAYLRYCWSRSDDIVAVGLDRITALAAALLFERETIKYRDAVNIIIPQRTAFACPEPTREKLISGMTLEVKTARQS